MQEYHKIQSIFKRDSASNNKSFLLGEWTCSEFGLLAEIEWFWTEKIDGTNIRVCWDGETVTFKGRTERAQIPATLFAALQEMFPPEKFHGKDPICLYGEGYGAKIQKGGGLYRADQSFVLFDVRVGDWWLSRAAVQDVATEFRLGLVANLGVGSLYEAINYTAHGFSSQFGTAQAEGLVLRPLHELFDRAGRRIITKIKTKDFRANIDLHERAGIDRPWKILRK